MISGYIRENYNHYFLSDISRICEDYYDDIFHCRLDYNYRNIFYSEKVKIVGKDTINIRGIEFRCCIERNALYLQTTKKFPENITDYTMIYYMYCPELKIGNTGKGINWKECKEAEHQKVWMLNLIDHQVKISKDINSLSFDIYADFTYISYDNDKPDDIYHDIKLNESIKYQWKIDEELCDKFRKADKGEKFFSDGFGYEYDIEHVDVHHVFYLLFVPDTGNEHKLELGYNILPKGVKKIHCNVEMKDGRREMNESVRYSVILWDTKQLVGYDDINKWFGKETMFTVTIEITKVIDLKNNVIPKQNWKLFGIQ